MCVRCSAQRSCMADVKALIHDDQYSPTSSSPISACSYLKGERQTDRVKHPTSSYFYHHLNLHKRKSRLKGGKELILKSRGGLGKLRFDLWSRSKPICHPESQGSGTQAHNEASLSAEDLLG